MSKWQYTKGLHDIGHGCFAYLQPDGSWGWSNAGLVTDGDQTLLVDTLFDLPLTAQMLKTMRDAVPAARDIRKLVNTHANGDHVFGNQLVEGAEIIACRACAEEFADSAGEHAAGLGDRMEESRRGRRVLPRGHGQPLRLERHRHYPADDRVRRNDGSHGRQQAPGLDPSRLGAHPRRRAGPRAGRPYPLHRRLVVRRRPSGHLGRPDRKLDQGLRLHFES